jgi:uncharacterized membrane protein
VVEGEAIVSSESKVEEEALASIRAHFAIGDFRTVDQDPAFGIRQIVDIAMKALSPGVNDTSTAVACVDYLSAILSRVALRHLDIRILKSEEIQRIVAPMPLFSDFVAKSLDEIRLSAAAKVSVILRMLGLVERVADVTHEPARKLALLQHARLIAQMADDTVPTSYDRARINLAIDAARHSLGAGEQLPSLSISSPDVKASPER